MKLKELAERLGVTSTTVSGYENGNNFPSIEVLYRYKDVFNVDLNWLLSSDTDRNIMLMDLNQKDQEMIRQFQTFSEDEKSPIRHIVKLTYDNHFKNEME